MSEDDAKAVMIERFGSDKVSRVADFLTLVAEENDRQNLIAPSTLATIWARHGLDSAQLLFHVEHNVGGWMDIGTGGGFPGMIIALLFEGAVTMVEPRKKRAAFLAHCVDELHISNAEVIARKVEDVRGNFDVISARAVASVEKLLQAANHCATPDTRWILPRGRVEAEQLIGLRHDRTRMFHVEQSITDPDSSILIVNRNKGRAR